MDVNLHTASDATWERSRDLALSVKVTTLLLVQPQR